MNDDTTTVERRIPLDWALFLAIYVPLLASRTFMPLVTGRPFTIYVVITTLIPAVICWMIASSLRQRGAVASALGGSAPLLLGLPRILIDPWGGGMSLVTEAILVAASVFIVFKRGPGRSMAQEAEAAPQEEHRFVKLRRWVIWTVLILPLLPLLPAFLSTSPNAGLVLLFPPLIFMGITIPALVIVGIASVLRPRADRAPLTEKTDA